MVVKQFLLADNNEDYKISVEFTSKASSIENKAIAFKRIVAITTKVKQIKLYKVLMSFLISIFDRLTISKSLNQIYLLQT